MPDGGRPVSQVVETHLSTLVFVGDRVAKLRKPVRFDFVDFTDRAERERDCHHEVAVNRRLAPDVYLGVLDLSIDGRPVDHAVLMRRLPDERRLARLVAEGVAPERWVGDLVRRLAVFHARAARGPGLDVWATPSALAARWRADLTEVAPFVGPVLDPAVDDRIRGLAFPYLAGRRRLLRRRIEAGAVCDGHGDLQADDIFVLEDGPRVLDAVQFDPGLRAVDVVADLAFLVMDLQRLGAERAAAALMDEYGRLTGDHPPLSLLRHYVAHRALVRAKVAALRADQGDAGAADLARALQRRSARALVAAQVRLVLVGGRPGSGKSTVAAGVASAIGGVVLRSDEIRKELAGLPVDRPVPAAWCEGLYAPGATAATYRTMVARAEQALALGVPVVLDATWTSGRWRDLARQAADATSSALVELRCDVPPRLADRRLSARQRAGQDPSDATVATGRRLAAVADPWPTATTVDTSLTRRQALVAALQTAGWPASMTPPPAASAAGPRGRVARLARRDRMPAADAEGPVGDRVS